MLINSKLGSFSDKGSLLNKENQITHCQECFNQEEITSDLKLKKKLIKRYTWNTALYG